MIVNYKILLFKIIILVLFTNTFHCDSYSVRDAYKSHAVYTSKNFRIYYREGNYSLVEVAAFAVRKEKLLERINLLLNTDFNETIDTYLYLAGNMSYAHYQNNEASECYIYIKGDSGHEIAHLVTYKCLGNPCARFFIEGFAVVLEKYYANANAISQFVLSYQYNPNRTIQEMILDNKIFQTDTYDYLLAGSFITYLINKWDMETFITFYKAISLCRNREIADRFKSIYKISLDNVIEEFIDYLTMVDNKR